MHSSMPSCAVSAVFDDPNLVADAGLVPVMRLAARGRLSELVRETVRIDGAVNGGGANPAAKVTSLIAAMCAGADSIEDADRLRHGAMPALFGGIRAPSTLGTFLRSFTHGHGLQLHAVHRRFLAELAARTPLLPGADAVAFVDVDSTHKRVFGPAKQGAQVGRFKGIRTLHPLLATICTPISRPVIAAVRLRQGKAADSRGAERFVTEALAGAIEAGCTGIRILRADSQFYNADVVAACRRNGTHFSITTGMNPSIKRAIAAMPEDAWTPIRYPRAVIDPDTGELISDAEVAQIPSYTAFTGRKKTEQVTARLIVRRVRDLAKPATVGEQGELFPVWRHHPFFTDSPFETLQAERHHRHHAVIEQVIADGKAGPLAHLPSGKFNANAAWLSLWAMSYNLLRAAGALAGAFHAKATTATIRTHLVHVPARIARSARRLTLHLPRRWPWHEAFSELFHTAHAPPAL
ncbi:IS1380 family transposase [Streptomyces millisiae]|uniref:IS1380 family transposase n=1 Tax=Streptomyces millisiae TaxID=3075542 RepID=A0ABU2LLS6_9ACTN|nr:IS1380 family transposase [Streptomyces sp. DSM 44918]MDT0318526.1 IS1380 family transposase [Streptomyces sp. DSM 44918]MDT0318548.1 IS1380 family transposase [Streptomyces sp. DSM 44918]